MPVLRVDGPRRCGPLLHLWLRVLGGTSAAQLAGVGSGRAVDRLLVSARSIPTTNAQVEEGSNDCAALRYLQYSHVADACGKSSPCRHCHA